MARVRRSSDQNPPGEIAHTDAARPRRANSSATNPPMELPARCGRSSPPPNIDPDDMVIDVNTKLTDVEHGGKPDPFVSSCE
jgi:hypothetical protein